MNLYEKLEKYSKDDYYPMHMPGHKRNLNLVSMINPYAIDITEIDDFDNLHHAEGILREGMERAARLYDSKHTNYLINGSTVGILAGIAACTKKGDKILVARNSHKAVYNAIYLNQLNPVYVYPQKEQEFGINGGLNPSKVKELLTIHQDIKLIVITSPTYEGIISDVKSITDIAHSFCIPILVDEAHGAHLSLHPDFPKNAVSLGADIVIHSLHKTLPSFTQTGLIHVNGTLVDYKEVKRYLSIYQTSSPSYLLMSSIEQCIDLLENRKDELFENYSYLLHTFYDKMMQLKKINVLNPYQRNEHIFKLDPSKVTISLKGTNMTGIQLYKRLLDDYKIQLEMVSMDYVLGMTSICDTLEGFQRLEEALIEIDQSIEFPIKDLNLKADGDIDTIEKSDIAMGIYEAIHSCKEVISFTESEGRITAEYIYLYPPGIPLLVPGERISKELILQVVKYKKSGLSIQGLEDMDGDIIKVVLTRN